MNILLILAHPDKNSFSHAISKTVYDNLCWNGYSVNFHDLYSENFNPMLPASEIPKDGKVDPIIEQHCKELTSSNGIVIVHPNWWGQPPAILKGWVDRVIRAGVAYEFEEEDSGEGVPLGLLKKIKAAVVFTTSNTSVEREKKVFLDPLETIWKNCIFDLCGVKNFTRRNFEIIVTSTPQQRQEWLKEAANIINFNFPEISFSKFAKEINSLR